MLFATQAGTQPPRFVLFSSGFLEATYRRFVERRLREDFGFPGTPVEISVRVKESRGKKGGRYHSLGSAKISSKATFTKRFTLRRTGYYRLRFKYKGSATVAGGTVVSRVRITRRFAF